MHCLRGASEIQSKVLSKIADPSVSVYAVWVPMLEMDEAAAVPEAMKYLNDRRVSHYWDAEGILKGAYSSVLGIAPPVWDVYLAYGRDAEWKPEQPPSPAYWMHQLRQLGQERRLDADQLAAEIGKLLSRSDK